MEGQLSLLEEEWEGVSIRVEDFKPEPIIMTARSKTGSFLEMIVAEVKDVLGMGKENMPATMS